MTEGSLVRATVVARWTGRHPRTVRAWIERGIVAGCRIDGRWYVRREEALLLRAGNRPKGRDHYAGA